jgi:hypothetical protein
MAISGGIVTTEPADFFAGLDLGQAVDFTALALLERPPATEGKNVGYVVRYLKRFPLGAAYTDVVASMAQLARLPLLAQHVTIVLDQTGVGRALVDMLRRAVAVPIVPVSITAGQTISEKDDGSQHVPKKELVTSLQLLLQGRRLKIPRRLPENEALVRELENFRIKITASAHETFGAGGANQHDDLVMALALACWYAESHPHFSYRANAPRPSNNPFANVPKGVFQTDDDGGLSHFERVQRLQL